MTPPTTYTLTGAADWMMFVFMCGGIGALLAAVVALVSLMWKDLRTQFKDSQTERRKDCTKCKGGINNEFGYVWKAIDDCCPRHGTTKRSQPDSASADPGSGEG